VLTVGHLAAEYGFTDVNGRQWPPFQIEAWRGEVSQSSIDPTGARKDAAHAHAVAGTELKPRPRSLV
jgi:hypothetical protein